LHFNHSLLKHKRKLYLETFSLHWLIKYWHLKFLSRRPIHSADACRNLSLSTFKTNSMSFVFFRFKFHFWLQCKMSLKTQIFFFKFLFRTFVQAWAIVLAEPRPFLKQFPFLLSCLSSKKSHTLFLFLLHGPNSQTLSLSYTHTLTYSFCFTFLPHYSFETTLTHSMSPI